MAEYLIQESTLDNIADAINAKTGGSSAMTPAQMVAAIGSISGGGDLSVADVTLTQDYTQFTPTAITLFRAAVSDAQIIVFQLIDAGTYQFINKDAVLVNGCYIYVEDAPQEVRDAATMIYRHYNDNPIQGPYTANTGTYGKTGTTYRVWGWNP